MIFAPLLRAAGRTIAALWLAIIYAGFGGAPAAAQSTNSDIFFDFGDGPSGPYVAPQVQPQPQIQPPFAPGPQQQQFGVVLGYDQNGRPIFANSDASESAPQTQPQLQPEPQIQPQLQPQPQPPGAFLGYDQNGRPIFANPEPQSSYQPQTQPQPQPQSQPRGAFLGYDLDTGEPVFAEPDPQTQAQPRPQTPGRFVGLDAAGAPIFAPTDPPAPQTPGRFLGFDETGAPMFDTPLQPQTGASPDAQTAGRPNVDLGNPSTPGPITADPFTPTPEQPGFLGQPDPTDPLTGDPMQNASLTNPGPIAPAAPKIPVALLLPEGSSRAAVQAQAAALRKAAELAATDAAAAANIALDLRVYDTKGDPNIARAVADQALNDGARLIIGPLFSASTRAVGAAASYRGVPVIAFTTDRAVLGPGVYSVGFLPEDETARVVAYAIETERSRIAILTPDSAYGRLVTNAAQRAAAEFGGQIVRVQPLGDSFQSLGENIQELAEAIGAQPTEKGGEVEGADAILIAAHGRVLQGAAAYLAYRGATADVAQLLGVGFWDNAETFKESALRGGWFAAPEPELRTAFDAHYKAAYEETPPGVARLAYDAVAVAAQALSAQNTAPQGFGLRPNLRTALENPEGFSGFTGLFRLLPNGANQRGLAILEVGRRVFTVEDAAAKAFDVPRAAQPAAPPQAPLSQAPLPQTTETWRP